MNLEIKIVFTLILLVLTSCGSIVLISENESINSLKQDTEHEFKTEPNIPSTSGYNGCYIMPKSGINKDIKYGYYFDHRESKCVFISYSSGPGCIPPPFKTLDECISCCGGSR